MTTKLTTKQAIEKVLAGKRKPMNVGAIAEAGIPLTALAGATPKQVFYSVLYSESKKADGLVVQTGPAVSSSSAPGARRRRRSPAGAPEPPRAGRAQGRRGPRRGVAGDRP